MSQQRLTWLADALRNEGCRVKTYEGWQTRSRPETSGSFSPFGVLWHHTGTPTSLARPAPSVGTCIHGRSDLPGPLCQIVIGFDGLCHVIAAGRANHAGTNDGVGTGPIPAGDGNAQMVGFEIDYSGSQDMGPDQMDAALRATVAVLKQLKRDESFVRGHKETSATGKWDPGRHGSSSPQYLMGDIRAQVAARLAGKDVEDMPDWMLPWAQWYIFDRPGGEKQKPDGVPDKIPPEGWELVKAITGMLQRQGAHPAYQAYRDWRLVNNREGDRPEGVPEKIPDPWWPALTTDGVALKAFAAKAQPGGNTDGEEIRSKALAAVDLARDTIEKA